MQSGWTVSSGSCYVTSIKFFIFYLWCTTCTQLQFYKLLRYFVIFIYTVVPLNREGLSWSYGSWIYNYMCNQCLSPLRLWVLSPDKVIKVCQWLATGRWFFRVLTVSSTNKTDHHDITEILLKVVLSTITLTLLKSWKQKISHRQNSSKIQSKCCRKKSKSLNFNPHIHDC